MKSLRLEPFRLAFSRLLRLFIVWAFILSIQTPQLLLAQDGASPPQPTTLGTISRMGFMFIMVYLIFHYLVIKPQKEKLVQQQTLLNTLKRGENVVTSGGIVAKVVGVEKDHAVLEIAANVRVKFEIAHIAKRLDKPAA